MPSKLKRHRYCLSLTPLVKGRLDQLVEDTGYDSSVEVIRQALRVYEMCVRTYRNGGRVMLEIREDRFELVVKT